MLICSIANRQQLADNPTPQGILTVQSIVEPTYSISFAPDLLKPASPSLILFLQSFLLSLTIHLFRSQISHSFSISFPIAVDKFQMDNRDLLLNLHRANQVGFVIMVMLEGSDVCESQQQSNSKSQYETQLSITQERLKKKRAPSSKKGTANKRWNAAIDDFLIPFLVEQAKEGYKVDKGFKRQAYVAAAKAVNTRFGTDFNAKNVDNHMRTLRSKYVEIKKCRDISGAGWDEQQKMIILEGETYQTYIKAHPKAADILNRPIKHYEELRIICGDDQATGYFKSSLFDEFGENNNEVFSLEYEKNDIEFEDEVDEIDGRFAQAEGARKAPNNGASSLSGRARSSAKRAREDPYLVDLVSCVGEVANALKRSAAVMEKATTHWMEELFTKIKEISGYKSEIYEAVFEYLCQSEMQARVFMTKDLDMRRSWFERYTQPFNYDSAYDVIWYGCNHTF
ncbi:hypothetical protein ACMD2_00694 [Ananas comosus]|uniref:Myb/SANT-like domain-containing protein n=1 Tax=Ananas comosus TaxID=4615 RepID=A0A199VDU9_ANACO|nr:hypothetical protein ACMD2_00694 [Ananas comosus]